MDFLENSIGSGGRRGSIEVITGSMFSGKTERADQEASEGSVCRPEG